jgi:hypothetical protein
MDLRFYTDCRLGGIPRYYVSSEEDKMLVPDEVRKCVVFLLFLNKNQKFRFAGTGFFVGVRVGFVSFIYLVTAKHVIAGIGQKSIDNKVYIRINDKQGNNQIVASDIGDWGEHPDDSSVDVSILKWAPQQQIFDYLVVPTEIVATDDVIKSNSIGLGDEVFVTGLFVSRFGERRNIPIVRVGNIASMPEEKIDGKGFGPIDAYLVESRSIGGLSGSPVFVHLAGARQVGGNIIIGAGRQFYLLGLMRGHWDRDENYIDGISDDIDGGSVNMGIAIVIPATKILEIINQSKWVDERQAYLDEEKKKNLPVEDTSSQDLAESDEQEKKGT